MASIATTIVYRLGLTAWLILSFASVSLAGTFVAFGPQDYARGTGKPAKITSSFSILNPATNYTLHVHNGGSNRGFARVSSASIYLNGVQVVKPNDFNQTVTVIEIPVSVSATNTLEVELRGKPGSGITLQFIGIDNDQPTINITSPANGTVVNLSTLSVTGTVGDGLSGVSAVTCNSTAAAVVGSSFTCDVLLSEGANMIDAVVTDNAGNMRTVSIVVNLDTILPIITATATPTANVAGWNNTPVTVNFNCTDSGSGIATCPASVPVDTEGANQAVSGTATDRAGNSSTVNVTVNLDRTLPSVDSTSPANGVTLSVSESHA